ncbi:hypothetical protein [Geomonas sp.]|uniref:hypothetical protein n=1 Tax=Geomonas sp. TaxID=2651584 RepID=UPI002B49A453|nr:hypothetical protein [Geomonas sp.]HJV33546.1 hypothetical protein [Geomonas sp.]
MTRVLLITDIERVQRVFQALEDEGVLQLQIVSTLALSDEELAQYHPDHIFAQSRISGFSSDVALRNLRKGLPPETRIVLLPVDESDLAQARKQAKLFLSLGRDDAALAEGVRRMLSPEGHAGLHPSEAAEEAAPAVAVGAKQEAVKKGRAVKGAARRPRAKAGAAAERGEQPAKATATAGRRKPASEAAPPATPVVPEEQTPEPLAAPEAPVAGPETFAEAMQRAAAKQAQDLVAPGPAPEPSPSSDRSDRSDSAAPEEIDEETLPVEAVPSAEPETLANGRLHAGKSKPRWIVALLLALLFVPIAYFATILLRQGKPHKSPPAIAPAPATSPTPSRVAPPVSSSPSRPQTTPPLPQPVQPPRPKPAPPAAVTVPPAANPVPQAKPALPAAQAPAPSTPGRQATSTSVPGTHAPLQPSAGRSTPAKVQSAPAAPAAKPAVKAGLKALPPFMAGVSVDPAYGARHPGWQRYLGARGEYKIYREGDLYRALQIIALPGQSIPDDIYQRSLLEFGGIDSYRVQSSERKGSLLIEHGEAKGGIGVIVYRKLKDLSMKGLVIYYH